MRGATSRIAGSGRRLGGLGHGRQRRASVGTAAPSADVILLDGDAAMAFDQPAAELPPHPGTGSGPVPVSAEVLGRALRISRRLTRVLRRRLRAAAGHLRERWA